MVEEIMNKEVKLLKASACALGFIDWFLLQAIYCSIAFKFSNPVLIFASLPINVITILIGFLVKQRWIAFSAATAFILNGIALMSMGLLGVIDDEAIIGICFLFPPFFLLFTNWFDWLL
jgi:hypothetical protein